MAPQKHEGKPSLSEGRLDKILKDLYTLTNNQSRNAISTGKVFVNSEVSVKWEHLIKKGDIINFVLNAPNPRKKQALGAELFYQDSSIAVLLKPAGLLSAPSFDENEDHALKAVSRLCRGPRRPRVVHRLDKETSGLLVFSRTLPATQVMREAIDHKRVIRKYRCLVVGRPTPDEGMITSMILRNGGEQRRGSAKGTLKRYPIDAKPQMPQGEDVRGAWAITKYRVVAFSKGVSAVEVEILTGRTHQIRIHMSEIRHPILGEWVYAKERAKAPRLALHAAQLTFKHPFAENVLHFEAPWPDDLKECQPIPKHWHQKIVPHPDTFFLNDIDLPEPDDWVEDDLPKRNSDDDFDEEDDFDDGQDHDFDGSHDDHDDDDQN